MECALEVQAVAVASLGPRAPYLMETWPAARLTMVAGMKKGEILRGPPFDHVGVFAFDDVEPADARADVDADMVAVPDSSTTRPEWAIASARQPGRSG